MKETDKYSDRDWEELAARYSGERPGKETVMEMPGNKDSLNTEKMWSEIGMTNIKGEINVDNAWNKLHNRLRQNGLLTRTVRLNERNRMSLMLRVAATVVIFAVLGAATLYFINSGLFSGERVVIAGNNQRNIEVSLADGSKVWLNRNSQLTYYTRNTGKSRNVKLKGEAFFDINHNASRPFIIDAGNAKIRDLGTSFNIITSNRKDEVEVFVSTGKVMLTDLSGSEKLILDPGYIGTLGKSGTSKSVNTNQNYLSWKTDLLTYDGESLKNVFTDLKRVYNINIIADDTGILNEKIRTTFDKSPQDTIIQIICTSFNLSYRKEGQDYHLSRK